MKTQNRNLALSIASGAACVILAVSFAASPVPGKTIESMPLVAADIDCLADHVGAVVGVSARSIELLGIRHFGNLVRPTALFSLTHLGFQAEVPTGAITTGRAEALVAMGVALLSLIASGLSWARLTGRVGNGAGRAGAALAVLLGLTGMVLSIVHLGRSTGGFGSGSGRAGAIIALILAQIGTNIGALVWARSRRQHRSPENEREFPPTNRHAMPSGNA